MPSEIRDHIGYIEDTFTVNPATAVFKDSATGKVLDRNEVAKMIADNNGEQLPKAIIVEIEATHSGITKNWTEYIPEKMQKSAPSWTSPYEKPVLREHNRSGKTLGRVKAYEYKKSELKPDAYTIKLTLEITDPDAIKDHLSGAALTYSIGGIASEVFCSICGIDILNSDNWCGHWKGRIYTVKSGEGKNAKEEKVRCIWQIGLIDYIEVSVVNVPADEYAQVIKINAKEEDAKESENEEDDNTEGDVEDIKKEEMGKGPALTIDNSKGSAKNGSWGSGLSEFRNKCLKASNYKSVVKEAYALVEDGWEDAPSQHLKYPHHAISGDKLVVHIRGVQAALARARQQKETSVMSHLRRHYRELGLEWPKDDTEVDIMDGVEAADFILDNENMEVQADLNDQAENKEPETKDEVKDEAKEEAKNEESDNESQDASVEEKTAEQYEKEIQDLKDRLKAAEEAKAAAEAQLKEAQDKVTSITAELQIAKDELKKANDKVAEIQKGAEQTFKTSVAVAKSLKQSYANSIIDLKIVLGEMKESQRQEELEKLIVKSATALSDELSELRNAFKTTRSIPKITQENVGEEGALGVPQDRVDILDANKHKKNPKPITADDAVNMIVNASARED